ncbi:DUF805 domain-containing protein [Kineosporia sp. NBRC 101731]|uniref:DUF805 domain-containing protein n=1 Tax=Kineosporia sp. NBRC 101731 TaxID=3032199 RepID=UPI0024A0960B|nr:DUF805 domain-containing protein [Kineosporia sp. NBRC 101731]GLY31109.1 membrane protein [Kineosporia sp. NBRC 101731]
MSFQDAVRTVLTKKYVDFSGRARRSEYWFWTLFAVIVTVVAAIIDAVIGFQIVTYIAFVALLLPGIAVTVRRLHDTGRSGFWYLIVFVPFVGGLVLFVFTLLDSEAGSNAYGPNPKGLEGGFGAQAAY